MCVWGGGGVYGFKRASLVGGEGLCSFVSNKIFLLFPKSICSHFHVQELIIKHIENMKLEELLKGSFIFRVCTFHILASLRLEPAKNMGGREGSTVDKRLWEFLPIWFYFVTVFFQ